MRTLCSLTNNASVVKKCILVFFIATVFAQHLFAQVPTITSFSPTSGPIGTTVTINGTNFNDTVANNIVYFGAVQATITNANDTTLIVTVPVGATYQPITITTSGLTAYSGQPFDVTFVDADTSFSTNSFAPKTDFVTDTVPHSVYIGDLDGDGKPDIIVPTSFISWSPPPPSSEGISILKNTGNISFAAKMDLTLPFYYNKSVSVNDLDGDGMPDLIVASQPLSVYRNISSRGNISFATRIDIDSTILYYSTEMGVAVNDLDGDGKPDIILADSIYGVLIYKNTSIPGTISFAARIQLPRNFYYPNGISISDIDGDGKPDICIIVSDPSATYFTLYRNTSTVGVISFANSIQYSIPGKPESISVADLDGDGKPDIAVAGNNTLSIFMNISTAGTVSLGTRADYPNDNGSQYVSNNVAIGDLDGDGKPDIAVSNFSTNTVSVFKNISSPGAISLKPRVEYKTGNGPAGIFICDLNADGRPDIVIANSGTNSISILYNQAGGPFPVQLCNGGDDTLTSNLSGSSYQWQINTGTGFTNFGGQTSHFEIENAPSTWYGYQYRCVVDGNNSDVYTLKFVDTWTGAKNSTWENPLNWSCGTVPDANTDVIINSGTVLLSSNTSVRSITINPTASFTVVSPFTLTVTH